MLISAVLAAAVVAVVVAALVGGRTSAHESSAPATTGASPAAPAKQSPDRPFHVPKAAFATARTFVETAVLRTDLRRAWRIVAPSLKEGYTLDRWLTGTIPVVPYPKSAFRTFVIDLIRAQPKDVMLSVLVVPRKGTGALSQTFFMHLVPAGKRWLVSYWAPQGHGAGIPGY